MSDCSSDVCSADLLERNGRVFRSLPLDPDCLQTNLAPVTCHTQHEQFDSFVEYTIAVYLQKRFLRKGDVRSFFGRQFRYGLFKLFALLAGKRLDRKSVVSGTRGSVRVALGVRRIIKKNT